MQDKRQNFSPIKRNIAKYLDYKGVSKYAFYQSTGISRGTLDNSSGLTEDNIAKFIAYAPEVNLSWLMTGEGSMLNAQQTHDQDKKNPPGKSTPLVSLEAVAGFGSLGFSIEENDVQDRYVVPDFNGIDFMIRVKGSSMYPKYNSGDVVACRIIKESKFIQWNKPYVIATTEQGIMVKRLHQGLSDDFLKAVSDNKEYPDFEIPKSEITGIALVIGVIRLE